MIIETNEYPSYYQHYLDLIKEDTLTVALNNSWMQCLDILQEMDDSKADYAYAEGKWTVKQVLQHVIDTERIFSYRALRIARNSALGLDGFDENSFAAVADVSKRSIEELLGEMNDLRNATIGMFESFSTDDLLKTGMANNQTVSVRALGLMIAGHLVHHLMVITDRYL